MNIRPFHPKDIEQLKQLYKNLYQDFQDKIFPQDLKKYEEFKNLEETTDQVIDFDLKSPDWKTFVAETMEGTLVGFIAGTIQEQSYYKLDKHGIIESFFIQEDYRGQGIGHRLLSRLEEWFQVKECLTIRTEVWVFNQIGIDIYENMGFKKLNLIMVKDLKQ